MTGRISQTGKQQRTIKPIVTGNLSAAPPWWSQAGSNRRPPACKAGALPAELWPHEVVGLGRFELPTSPLSGVRSNQLSYRPKYWSRPVAIVEARCGLPGNLCWALEPRIGLLFKGGDPAAGSPTATLLRLHPSHEPHRGSRPPEG